MTTKPSENLVGCDYYFYRIVFPRLLKLCVYDILVVGVHGLPLLEYSDFV